MEISVSISHMSSKGEPVLPSKRFFPAVTPAAPAAVPVVMPALVKQDAMQFLQDKLNNELLALSGTNASVFVERMEKLLIGRVQLSTTISTPVRDLLMAIAPLVPIEQIAIWAWCLNRLRLTLISDAPLFLPTVQNFLSTPPRAALVAKFLLACQRANLTVGQLTGPQQTRLFAAIEAVATEFSSDDIVTVLMSLNRIGVQWGSLSSTAHQLLRETLEKNMSAFDVDAASKALDSLKHLGMKYPSGDGAIDTVISVLISRGLTEENHTKGSVVRRNSVARALQHQVRIPVSVLLSVWLLAVCAVPV